MKFYTIPNLKPNTEFLISFKNEEDSVLKLTATSYYTLFQNGHVIDFGPTRSADSVYRVREIKIKSNSEIVIKFIFYGIPTFEFANHDFSFGIELLNESGKETDICKLASISTSPHHCSSSSKFSFQRAFIERYDFKSNYSVPLTLKEISGKCILSSKKVENHFPEIFPNLVGSNNFLHFESIIDRNYLHFEQFKEINNFDVNSFLHSFENSDYLKHEFEFESIVTGLIKLDIESTVESSDVLVVFDEFSIDSKVIVGKDNCSDIVTLKVSKGHFTIFTNVPYSYKQIIIISKKEVIVKPSSILVQNTVQSNENINNNEVKKIFDASLNTFNQNSYDIFTDCPSRERAGWLCDSYFTGMAERMFSGSNTVENQFLENIIYSNSVELPKDVVAMCYPAEHVDKTFIPNWCLWFILELKRYYDDTSDSELIAKARDKVVGILSYFKRFEVQNHLLNNLESWIFVEWSKANDEEFVKGINFPTNMIYYAALLAAYNLYKIDDYYKTAVELKTAINDLSFNGSYFVDNAIYENDHIEVFKDHISETCQYYAAFTGVCDDESFIKRILEPKINNILAPSAPFIGKVLRLLLLKKNKRDYQLLEEFVPYYYEMASKTGTLWEKLSFDGSLNHGFASVVGPLILEAYKNNK